MSEAFEDDGLNLTVRERMEKLGWGVNICEDTCAVECFKVPPGERTVSAYRTSDKNVWACDLEACQKAYGYLDGRSAYA